MSTLFLMSIVFMSPCCLDVRTRVPVSPPVRHPLNTLFVISLSPVPGSPCEP